jgi:hypothetical protein
VARAVNGGEEPLKKTSQGGRIHIVDCSKPHSCRGLHQHRVPSSGTLRRISFSPVELITDNTLIFYVKFAWPHFMGILVGTEKDTKIFVLVLFATCFEAGFLLGLYFKPEDGGVMFLLSFSRISALYTALYSRRQNSSIFCLAFNSHT